MKDSLRLYPDPFLPEDLQLQIDGVRPSVARILDMIDKDDPALARVASVINDMIAAGVELDSGSLEIAIKLGHGPAQKRKPERPAEVTQGIPMWGEAQKQSIVYYIGRGELIKIGTTTRPEQRFATLVPDEILAFEPGDRRIEAARHQQFEDYRQGTGEYFRRAMRLLRHVKKIRAIHGDPDRRWTTVKTVGRRRRQAHAKTTERPESIEIGSGADVARALGVSPGTVRAWASRGHLKPIVGSKPNRPLYFVDDARELAERSKKWCSPRGRTARE